jgi:hypothetical protein
MMIVPHPYLYLNLNRQALRCTVATQGSLRLGWWLAADWMSGRGEHVVRLDGDDYPTWHDPAHIQLHDND